MANTLGLSCYFHDSAAAIVCNGEIVAAASEERFCRRKHTSEFPKNAVEYCLDAAGLSSINDLDAIVFYEKPLAKLDRAVETFVETWPSSFQTFVQKFPTYLKTKMNVYREIEKMFPAYKGQILFSQHHLSHAASAFYCSPFQDAAILTIDGVGEWETTTIGVGRHPDITLEKTIRFPHSIGLLYSALTGYLGFRINDAEWKVMGLAPYGEPKYVDQFRKLVDVRPDGSFQLNLEYFSHHYSAKRGANYKKWEELFGFAPKDPNGEIQKHHEDLARSGQVVVEELILNLAREAKRISNSENLVIAGGVGLNSVANWRIEKEGIFKNVWIQPAAGDDGAALGAALLVSQSLFKEPRSPEMKHAYWGPEYTDQEIKNYLEMAGIPYEHFSESALIEKTADLIAAGKVIGWFQGRMEFGPRSLGARSILATPTSAEMKSVINAKIKFREYFRPFAPAVPLEHVSEYFEVEDGTELPFMLKVPKVREDARHKIPAVTHEDGTGRVQTVTEESNPLYYKLLKALTPRTGVPVILNTSFNVRGEPIVCSPDDAYRCFIQTGLDALVLGNYIVTVKPNANIDFTEGYKRSNLLEANPLDQTEKAEKALSDTLLPSHGKSETASIGEKVLAFYRELPFNYYSNSVDTAKELLRANRIKEAYPPLHKHLKNNSDLNVIDIGSGAGWFVNSCGSFYGHEVLGLELNPVAIKQAKAISRLVPGAPHIQFVQGDLFEYTTDRKFDVVNSLGVLHHTADCHGAIGRALELVKSEGYLHLGLYHSYGRKPFLDHFNKMRITGASDAQLYEEFKRLNPDMKDETHLISWFRDQVLHPHETQHSYEEIEKLVTKAGFVIEATSINNFKKMGSLAELVAKEKTYEELSKKALYQKHRYFPGFFVIWARAPKA